MGVNLLALRPDCSKIIEKHGRFSPKSMLPIRPASKAGNGTHNSGLDRPKGSPWMHPPVPKVLGCPGHGTSWGQIPRGQGATWFFGAVFLSWNHFLQIRSVFVHLPWRVRCLPSCKLRQLWKITLFNGQMDHKLPFSIAMLVYQGVRD